MLTILTRSSRAVVPTRTPHVPSTETAGATARIRTCQPFGPQTVDRGGHRSTPAHARSNSDRRGPTAYGRSSNPANPRRRGGATPRPEVWPEVSPPLLCRFKAPPSGRHGARLRRCPSCARSPLHHGRLRSVVLRRTRTIPGVPCRRLQPWLSALVLVVGLGWLLLAVLYEDRRPFYIMMAALFLTSGAAGGVSGRSSRH